MKKNVRLLLSVSLLGLGVLGGCGDDDPVTTDTNTACQYDSGLIGLECSNATYTEQLSACVPEATDYQPRAGVPAANGWPACISDDNLYHLIGDSIPAAAARSIAFEAMGERLWKNPCAPTQADFLAARLDYATAQGLGSRVARRQDVSYPEVPGDDKFACSNEGVPEVYPDRCAGPAKLKPIIDDAFVKGDSQEQPLVQAARIEAALLWFFYLSMTSEVWTCSFDDMTDCDSAVGYYTQLSPRDAPTGLARYVAALGLETHNRIYDALLAERCWRDIDQELPAVSATSYYDLAQAQLDRATLRGIALILRERIGRIVCLTGEPQQAQIEFVRVLGGLLNHAAGLIDATLAQSLKAYTDAPTTDAVASANAQGFIDQLFDCP